MVGTLEHASLPRKDAQRWESRIRAGALLVGGHVQKHQIDGVREVLTRAGGQDVVVGSSPDERPL